MEFQTTGKWFLLSGLIGVVAGLGAIAFQWIGQAIEYVALARIAGYEADEVLGERTLFASVETELIPWMIVVVMAVGGLLSGLLVYLLAPEAEGHGTDAAIDAFHNRRGEIRARIPLVKMIASAITLGTGGSAGREGPIAQIGAGFGSLLGGWLKLSARDRRILLAAGMGAGVGAIFRAPLAGALFAGEILYRDAELEADVIVPAAVSSTIGYAVFGLWLPSHLRFAPLFGRDVKFEVASAWELLPYAALALLLVVASIAYVRTFYGVQSLFRRLPIIPHLQPMIGAALAGLVGLGIYYALGEDKDALAVLGSGYGLLQKVFGEAGTLSVGLLLAVALLKIFTTSLTISSGGSGGVFGPSIVIGGCLGAAVGQIFHQWWPEVVTQPQAFAIVGMAGFFAGCARAPFSTILMVAEMTGDYKLLLPTMWVATLCFLLARGWTIYEKQVPTRLDSPAHRGDFIVDVLEGMHVEDVYQKNRRLKMIPEATTLDTIVHQLADTQQRYFPVVDEEQRMVGIFSVEDVRSYLYDDAIWQVANARDVMTSPVITLVPRDDLNTALRRFTALNVDELPVVDPAEPGQLLGVLRRKETIAAYNRRRLEHMQAE
ncbi:MAG: CBS domain-containing protein [Planctomycetota bacterium]|nr:MAG: CBS domain-containing protein [Planctomycetota bacterium]REK27929.1 MAG: CBS domain-containing protein [Planctomycetota bacterium]REK40366.1 MAG: CBS domain-containing protein [Planctomycetota bacterium]